MKILQITGLCPLLIVCTDLSRSVILAAAFLLVYLSSMSIVGALRRLIPGTVMLPALLVINSSVVSCIWYFLQGNFYNITARLGIYVLLLAMNPLLLYRLEMVALRVGFRSALRDGAVTGTLFAALLAGFGLLRELLLTGSVTWSDLSQDKPVRQWTGPELVDSPAGALLLFGCLLAVVNHLECRRAGATGRD